jgi:Ras-related protein Rab-2A
LVFDVTNRQSFESISKWYTEIQGYACDKIILVIVGNKIDMADRREVSYEEAKKLADS